MIPVDPTDSCGPKMIHADQNMESDKRNISLSVNEDQMEKKDVIKGYVKCSI